MKVKEWKELLNTFDDDSNIYFNTDSMSRLDDMYDFENCTIEQIIKKSKKVIEKSTKDEDNKEEKYTIISC